MRAVGFMLLGALIALIVVNHDASTHNQDSILKTKERIAEASRVRG